MRSAIADQHSVRRNLAALTDRADFLGGHSIIRLSPAQISQAALWSCRAWAGYVILQLAHLYEDFRQLRVAERKVLPREERAELGKRRRHLENDLLVNLGYLPLTLQVRDPARAFALTPRSTASSVGSTRTRSGRRCSVPSRRSRKFAAPGDHRRDAADEVYICLRVHTSHVYGRVALRQRFDGLVVWSRGQLLRPTIAMLDLDGAVLNIAKAGRSDQLMRQGRTRQRCTCRRRGRSRRCRSASAM